MPIPCICPHCGARFTAPDKAAGRIAPCPKCKQAITIPDPRAVVPVQPLPSSQPPPQPQVVVVQAPQQPQDDFSNLESERMRQRGSTGRMFAWMASAPILAFTVVTASLLAILFTCCGLPILFFGLLSRGTSPTESAEGHSAPLVSTAPLSTTGSTAKNTGKASPDEEWTDVRKASIRLGQLEAWVVSAQITKIKLRSLGSASESADPQLLIWLAARNHSQEKILEWSTWGHFSSFFGDRTHAHLKDNLGNTYRMINFGSSTYVVGRATDTRIRPGAQSEDVLVFELPVEKAKELFLDFEGPKNETIRFRFPTTWIQR